VTAKVPAVGDFLDKPIHSPGILNLGSYVASALLLGFTALRIVVFPQKAGAKSH
jgi:uncharacterized membrane-anchored protein